MRREFSVYGTVDVTVDVEVTVDVTVEFEVTVHIKIDVTVEADVTFEVFADVTVNVKVDVTVGRITCVRRHQVLKACASCSCSLPSLLRRALVLLHDDCSRHTADLGLMMFANMPIRR